MSATLNGLRVLSARIVTPWRGAWFADLDLDPDVVTSAPTSGPATLIIGTAPGPVSTLVGTVDPRASGGFVSSAKACLVAGAGGWDKRVASQHFHSDGGLQSSLVITSTAQLVGETVNVVAPIALGPDYVRTSGPASRVLSAVDWYVDPAGVTQVGPRPVIASVPTLEILNWNPDQLSATLSCDALVLPGTTLADKRIPGGSVVVRDVEQTFDRAGSRATAWCSAAAVSRISNALAHLVRELGGIPYLRTYRYRVVQEQGDGRLSLQAVEPHKGCPDSVPLKIWPGMSGDSAKLKLSSEVLVHFVAGDASEPIVLGFSSDALPNERTVDATVAVHVGPSAPAVDLAGGGNPIARLGDQVQVFIPPGMLSGTMGPPGSTVPFTGLFTIANPITGVITAGSGKASTA